ncbi:MAG TPA: hypothetical protein VFO78_12960 [Candidatus Limnocylindrales bacterium]|nr:hypothetical protein [Candidatus Limnocylindrales bacterium]
MTSGESVVAVGGTRRVPEPDPIARDYLLLALRLDQHVPGLVDGYFGPAVLKAQVDTEQLHPPADLVDDAAMLIARLPDEVGDDRRRDWLNAQVVALKTQASALAGEALPYTDHVARCFAWAPERRSEGLFDAAAADLERLLPGDEPLADRLAAWDARFEIPVDRLPLVVDWLVERFRERAERLFGLPEGESLRVAFVNGQPWSGYNWYDGGLRSRVDINTDLPVRAFDLVQTVAHETFPGHHLEHAWKEADLVDALGRMEASILLINTPECLISEGLADVGREFASPPDEDAGLLVELYERAGLHLAADPRTARDAAERTVAMALPRRRLSETRVNAALMRHADGASHDETLAYLTRVGRFAPHVAAKRLEFIEHPLWRTYVFVYHEGEALLRRWLAAVPETRRAARFGRLLHEQLTPTAIAAEAAPSA